MCCVYLSFGHGSKEHWLLSPQGRNMGEAGQPMACSHTRQHFLLLTHKTSPLIGSVVYRRSAGNNNKHVFTPEPFTQENTCTHTLIHLLTHTHTQARTHTHTHTLRYTYRASKNVACCLNDSSSQIVVDDLGTAHLKASEGAWWPIVIRVSAL